MCSTVLWLSVVSSTASYCLVMCSAVVFSVGRQFDCFLNVWSCFRTSLGCRALVRLFLKCLVVCLTVVFLLVSLTVSTCLVVFLTVV